MATSKSSSKRSKKPIHAKRKKIARLLALLIVALLGVLLWRHLRPPKLQRGQTQVQTEAQANPYAGWKTYTIPKSTLSFQYPPGWQLNPTTGPLGPWASPGTPETALMAPNGLYVDILTDENNSASEADNVVLLAQPLKTLGTTDYIDYIDAVGDHNVTYAALLSGPINTAPYPTITMPGGVHDRLVVSIAYQVKSGPAEKPLRAYRSDSMFQQAKLVVASLRD